jgi:hypothetical protein
LFESAAQRCSKLDHARIIPTGRHSC